MDASQIAEHTEVVGSDGQHVGTVDGVEGERIKLTKTDEDAGGEHHYIPLTAVSQVTDVVMLTESAENAKTNWTTEQVIKEVVVSHRDDNPQNGIFELLDEIPYQTWYALGIGSVAVSAILQAMGRKNAADFVGKWPPTFLAVGLYHALVRPGDEDVARKVRRQADHQNKGSGK